jgi:hypothetical protein
MQGYALTALAYAARGWPVFPCKPGSKEPDTLHGFKDATTDPCVIRAWWQLRPDRNVAIATGSPAVDVLDVDIKPGGSGFAAFNRLKQAGLLTGASALVRTRSGGLHVYFGGTRQECRRLPRHFIDFKAAGGYVIAPPSFVAADDTGPAGTYDLLEQRDGTGQLSWAQVQWLLDPPRAAGPRPPRSHGLGHLAAWVAALPDGNRNNGLYWAACRAIEGGGDAELLIAASGLPETEARRTVASAARRAGQ